LDVPLHVRQLSWHSWQVCVPTKWVVGHVQVLVLDNVIPPGQEVHWLFADPEHVKQELWQSKQAWFPKYLVEIHVHVF